MDTMNKAKQHIKRIQSALYNVEYGRMPVTGYLDKIFENHTESVRNLISAMKDKEAADKAV